MQIIMKIRAISQSSKESFYSSNPERTNEVQLTNKSRRKFERDRFKKIYSNWCNHLISINLIVTSKLNKLNFTWIPLRNLIGFCK
jgi:hypothetical protein